MSPKRRFGTPSRAANSKPYDKVEAAEKSPDKVPKGAVDFILNQEPASQLPVDHATRLDSGAGVGSPALDLPFIKDESFNSSISTLVKMEGSPQEFQEKYERFQESQGQHVDSPGMPSYDQWQAIVNRYLRNLHERKRDKALITRAMHEMIFDTLSYPESTRVGTPQFRFWARKMFQLVEIAGVSVITHVGRPVAVKEHMYEILCMCHAESDHAGRDKTCKVLRNYYTWIPKELVANFVKACPTCSKKRAFDTLVIDTCQIGQLIIPKREAVCMATPSPLTESPVTGNSLSLTGPLSTCGPNDARTFQAPYTIDGKIAYPVSGQYPAPRGIHTSLAQLPRRVSYPFDFNALGLPSHGQGHSGAEILTLPPMNNSTVDIVEARNNNTVTGPMQSYCTPQVSGPALPPLMNYLTKDGRMSQNGRMLLPSANPSTDMRCPPIDPSLLGDMQRSQLTPTSGMASISSGPSRSFPPTPLLTIGILGEHTPEEAAFVAGGWHRTDAGAPLSTSPNLRMSISPYPTPQAFFSPVPMKIEEKSPILNLSSNSSASIRQNN